MPFNLGVTSTDTCAACSCIAWQAAQVAGEAGVTRTEGRAVGRSTDRARRQQMRVELREANAARRCESLRLAYKPDHTPWLLPGTDHSYCLPLPHLFHTNRTFRMAGAACLLCAA